MTRYLVDTNLLVRIANGDDAQHDVAKSATLRLITGGDQLYLTSQILVEFWSVATRPAANNGLNWEPSRVERQLQIFLSGFQFLQEVPQVFDAWRRLVVAYDVRGKRVHDARLVAVMEAHQITHILTFNVVDFIRYPTITAVNPASVVATS